MKGGFIIPVVQRLRGSNWGGRGGANTGVTERLLNLIIVLGIIGTYFVYNTVSCFLQASRRVAFLYGDLFPFTCWWGNDNHLIPWELHLLEDECFCQ